MHDIVSNKILNLQHIIQQMAQRIANLEKIVAENQQKKNALLSQATSSIPEDLE
jgi:hypothetical protein